MNQNQEITNLKKALNYAVRIIENYQADIRRSNRFGVDLVEIGFCQGDIYQNAIDDIFRIACLPNAELSRRLNSAHQINLSTSKLRNAVGSNDKLGSFYRACKQGVFMLEYESKPITILEPTDPRWHRGWFDDYNRFIEAGVVVVEDFDSTDDPNDEDVETLMIRVRTTGSRVIPVLP